MNEQLKFSWGHIIAFLALIFISYTTFVGAAYSSEGGFVVPGIITLTIVVVLLLFFVGSQIAKATIRKFSKVIWIERLFILFSPIVFLLSMIPSFHFWAVHNKEEEVVEQFSRSINASKQIFVDYEEYSNNRIKAYEEMLTAVISNKDVDRTSYNVCGFKEGVSERSHKENMVQTLQLQLLSVNYDSLKSEAIKWIDESDQGASTWNVFLLGNTEEIKDAIHSWFEQLSGFSETQLSNENTRGNKVNIFGEPNRSLTTVDEGIEELTSLFRESSRPPIWSFLIVLLLYGALLLPYLLQDRHTKSEYRLIGMRKSSSKGYNISISSVNNSNDKHSISNINQEAIQDEDDDYASFKL